MMYADTARRYAAALAASLLMTGAAFAARHRGATARTVDVLNALLPAPRVAPAANDEGDAGGLDAGAALD
ncbi:hypothetical protein [Burkholderia pseudomallei]|uniref:hypothetical protein n=1 Tax=Burkholderia pseudomallei TaxID=28450 RepID=UPI00292CCBA8|nr:hypothetical protein [Burkholderia pseudomallei]